MSFRNTSILFGVALVAAAVTPLANADQWDKRTTITINEPVEVPSCCNANHVVVLQPGTYVIALAIASQSDRHSVRIFEQDGKTVITTILAVPNYRLKPTGKSVFQFWETPAGQPQQMRAWFYPGDNFGQEFAYHKTKSIEIARVAKADVPAAVVETEADLETAPVVIVNAKGEEKPVEVLVAQNEPPAQPAFVPQTTVPAQETPAPAELPATASEYPLFGLLGLGAVIASFFMSRLAKRA
ncbi:MAG: hypothetical protein ABSG41_11965 [Bryobacteraceae bacterium]|jgi:hypothetical protein